MADGIGEGHWRCALKLNNVYTNDIGGASKVIMVSKFVYNLVII